MQPDPRICVVIPVYNHGRTVLNVVGAAKRAYEVIVVDDGSTDETASKLSQEPGIRLVTLTSNHGKGAALQAGFRLAEEQHFTHVITVDADGQHSLDALESFARLCRAHPEALIVGVRDLKQAGAPLVRRVLNALSSLGFRLETGQRLADTQCGYRCYPLALVRRLEVGSGRYAFELEVLVKAAWAGAPLLAHPVAVDYTAPTSRLSHFKPGADLTQITWLHARLLIQRLLHGGVRSSRGDEAHFV